MAVEEPPMREDAAQAAPSQRRQQGVPGGGGTPPGALTPRGPPPLLPDGSAKGDDELTSLSWLQDTNLLRKLAGPPAASSAGGGGSNHQGNNGTASGRSSANAMSAGASPGEEDDSREWGPPGQVPYNPQVHVTSKPPYSFSCLIFMAIEESAGKALPVKDIYAWILGHFPYFQRAPTGWKNSVRHNLSLNKCFRKVDKDKGQNIGKGSLWCIDPEFRPNLLQAMRKTPCFPYTQLNWAPSPHAVPSSQQDDNGDQALSPDPSQAQNNVPSPMLFPFLSKRLAASSTKDQDVDAAATMLALQNGPSMLPPPSDEEDEEEEEGYRDDSPPSPIVFTKKHLRLRQRATSEFIRTPPATNSTVITTSPSEDHTYSASLANGGGGGDSTDGAGIAISAVRSLAQSLSPQAEEEDNLPEENSNGSSSGGGVGGLGRLPLSSVPPRKRRAALAAAAALPRKSRRTSASSTRRSSNGSAATAASSSDHAQDMAEGAAHALLNLAKVATSQQQLLLQANSKPTLPAILRERR